MRTLPRLLAAVLVTAVLVGCSDVGRDVVATVDGIDIPRAVLEDSVVTMIGDTSELTAEQRAELPDYEREFLGFFIQDLVYERALADAGVEFTADDAAQALDAEIAMLGGPDEYEAQLAEYGVTLALFEALVRLDAQTTALRRHVVGDQLARGVRHILVETEAEANDVIASLGEGADFGELAAEVSRDPGSASSGGAYPPAPRGQWVSPFDDAVWGAAVGELVGPIETVHGFHVIEVLDEVELRAADLEPPQLEQLGGPGAADLLEAAFQAAEVQVASSIGTWDPATRRVVPANDEVGVAPSGGGQPLPEG